MSFTKIPNEAIDHMTKLTAGAWRLYCFLLRCRNSKTGRAFPSVKIAAEAIDTHSNNIYRLRKELIDIGWVEFDGDEVKFLLGVESRKNAKTSVDKIEDSETEGDFSKNAKPFSKNAKKFSKNAKTYKEQQDELTRRNEQDELIPVAVAPGSLTSKECYSLFVELRTTIGGYEAPYQNQTADFVHLAKLFKNCERTEWTLTREKFTQAAMHYFETPQKVHTLADLATRFSEFYKSAFDKFGKPVPNGNGKLAAFTPAAQKTVAALESWLKQGEESEGA